MLIMAEYLQGDQSFSWASAGENLPLLYSNSKGTYKTAHPGSCCQLQANVCARLLVNCLFKLAQEISVVSRTDRPAMTIAVDLGR